MNLKTLNNSQVLSGFSEAVKSERKIMHLVLEYIIEVERRKLYLEQGFTSMLEFMCQVHRYSRSAAQRRIDSAKLLKNLPEIAEKIEKGTVSLTQLHQVQQAVRFSEKENKTKVSLTEKSQLIAKIESSTQKQTDQILAKELNFTPPKHIKETYHVDESMTLALPFTKEEIAILEEAKNLASNSVPAQKWNELFVWLARKYIKSQTTIRNHSVGGKLRQLQEGKTSDESTKKASVNSDFKEENFDQNPKCRDERKYSTAPVLKVRQNMPVSLKKFVLQKAKGCQFKNQNTGHVCGSQKYLQIDHIKPIWAGGTNEASNLQVLCSEHNRYRYLRQAGIGTA